MICRVMRPWSSSILGVRVWGHAGASHLCGNIVEDSVPADGPKNNRATTLMVTQEHGPRD